MGTRPPRPAQPQALRLDVARVAREKGVLSKRGPMAGQPSVDALRRGAGIGYATAHELLRWPNRLARIDLATLERVAQFYGVHPAELFVYDAAIPPRERPQPATSPLKASAEGGLARLRRVGTGGPGGYRQPVPPAFGGIASQAWGPDAAGAAIDDLGGVDGTPDITDALTCHSQAHQPAVLPQRRMSCGSWGVTRIHWRGRSYWRCKRLASI
jgi:transcriptional regulator with XRE-family HTH domain